MFRKFFLGFVIFVYNTKVQVHKFYAQILPQKKKKKLIEGTSDHYAANFIALTVPGALRI